MVMFSLEAINSRLRHFNCHVLEHCCGANIYSIIWHHLFLQKIKPSVFEKNEAFFWKRHDVIWHRRKISVQHKKRMTDFHVSLLYTFLSEYCSLSTKMFYMIFRMKSFGCAVSFFLLTFYVNIITKAVKTSLNYYLLFDFRFCVRQWVPKKLLGLRYQR